MKLLRSLLIIGILVLAFSTHAWAAEESFIWDANPLSDNVKGYRLYYQVDESDIIESEDILTPNLSYTLSNLSLGLWSFWLTAFNEHGESNPTEKLTKNINVPGTPVNFRFVSSSRLGSK